MSLLVVSPDFASHYGPLAVVASAVRSAGCRVVVATGPTMRTRVLADGFEWRALQLGASSNDGVAAVDPGLRRFIDATRAGPVATLGLQAREREHDLLWEPERVATDLATLCAEIDPEQVLVDHVSFGSTLAMRATGRPFVTLVPGHPSQLPVGPERYGVPARWPSAMSPDDRQLAMLDADVDRMTAAFTRRWNEALTAVSPAADAVDDAFRVHGRRVLYNSVPTLHDADRTAALPDDHRFVGPLVRTESLPADYRSWSDRSHGRPQVYVALGTFLSHRADVLGRIAAALRGLDARAAIAVGPTPADALGARPADWLVAPRLPQVAMLRHADLVIHHGGNNSVQESLAGGVRQLVLPFSTDQFANAVDLERTGSARVLAPNDASVADLADAVAASLAASRPSREDRPDAAELVRAVFA